MDPNEIFIVSKVTRKQVAEALNDAAEYAYSGIGQIWTKITDTDQRLTREICQEYADNLNWINDDCPNEDEIGKLRQEMALELREKLTSQNDEPQD